MDIIALLKECISDDFSDDINYQVLIDNIGRSSKNQKSICDFVLNNDLSNKEAFSILKILTELYNFQKEENYILSFELLYNWLLERMFSNELYEYSICYKFSRILTKIANNNSKVYRDIINCINVNDPVTVQIAICSTYGLGREFFHYRDLISHFLEKISESYRLTEVTQIVNDFNHFMKKPLLSYGYRLIF